MPGLDINWFRQDKGYDPNIIRESLKRRYRDPKAVDLIIEMDQQWRKRNSLLISSQIRSRLPQKRVERYPKRYQKQKESQQIRQV